jgi:signal transduction histidine kinase
MNASDGSKRATILVVDDTPDNLALMSNLLMVDYKVKIANSGAKALRIAASDTPPDLILLDIMMPGMDGYQVCRQLKKDPGTRQIPVIFLTARAEREDEQLGLELGAVDYITKPISPPIVLARVKNHLALQSVAEFLRDQNSFLEAEVGRRTDQLLAVRELALRNQQLKEAMEMKAGVLANMGHDLRTPLNSVIGFSELVLGQSYGPVNDKQREFLDAIRASGRRLLLQVNGMLELSRAESGGVELELGAFSLRGLLEAALAACREPASRGGVELRLTLAPELEGGIVADQRKLSQILAQLLSNAVRFTPAGGFVELSALGEGELLEIGVADSGSGISTDDLPKLFQLFAPLDAAQTRNFAGTGLGLALARSLVELHGGRIWAEGRPGGGSSFRFTVALVRAPAAGPAPGRSASP